MRAPGHCESHRVAERRRGMYVHHCFRLIMHDLFVAAVGVKSGQFEDDTPSLRSCYGCSFSTNIQRQDPVVPQLSVIESEPLYLSRVNTECRLGPQLDEQRRVCRKTSGLHKSGSLVYLTCLLSPFRSYRNSNYASFSPLFAILHNAKICESLENGKLLLLQPSRV